MKSVLNSPFFSGGGGGGVILLLALPGKAENMLTHFPLSNDIIRSRIDDMSNDFSSCITNFKPSKIKLLTRRDHQCFQSKPAYYIWALFQRRQDKGYFFFVNLLQ